jgi:competence protein ComEA
MDPSTPSWRAFDAPPATAPHVGGSDAPPPTAPAPIARMHLASPQLLIAIGLAVAGLAIASAILLASTGAGGAVALDPGAGRPLDSGRTVTAAGGGEIVVDVAGAVLRPGVYHLAAGARIGDAIAAAGGYSPRVAADLVQRSLNLAALVHDGDLIVVPSRDDPASQTPGSGGAGGAGAGTGGGGSGGGTGGGGSGAGGSGGAGSLVNLNLASADELDALPGIGPVTAAKIIASRTGTPFTSVDQLLERKLVGQKAFDQLRALVTVR